MNPLHLLWIIPLSCSLGIFTMALIAVNNRPECKNSTIKCKNCPHFGSYCITPRAYNHYQEDIFYEEPRQDFKNRFDGVVGICKHPEFDGKITVSEDYCYRGK